MSKKNPNPNQNNDGTEHLREASPNTLRKIQEQLADTDCLDTPYGKEVNREVMKRLNNNPPAQ